MPRPLLFAGWQVAVRREPKTPAKGGSVAQTEAGSGFRRLKANKKSKVYIKVKVSSWGWELLGVSVYETDSNGCILHTLCSTYFFDHVFVYCVRLLSFWFEPTPIASPIQWWFDETLCHHDDEPMNNFFSLGKPHQARCFQKCLNPLIFVPCILDLKMLPRNRQVEEPLRVKNRSNSVACLSCFSFCGQM